MNCKQCPLFDGYRFKTKCQVDTCKYYTERTKSKCMGLDTVFSATEKGVTDAELRFLKIPEQTKREAFVLRRDAQEKVQVILALHQAALICREEMDSDVFPMETPVTTKIMQHPLFKDPDIGLEVWMLTYLLDAKFMKRVGNPKIHILFNVSEKELELHHS